MNTFKVFHKNQESTIDSRELTERLALLTHSKIDGIHITVCDDLTLLQTAKMPLFQRLGWHISRHSSWLKQYLYHVNTEQTAQSLQLIEKKIATSPNEEPELLSLFEQTIDQLNTLSTADHYNYNPMTLAIHRAIIARNLKKVIYLVAGNHAYLSLCNNQGETPLHVAFKKNYGEIAHFLITESPLSDLVVQEGMAGNTPLHLAVIGNDRSNVEGLLRKGVDITMTNHEGLTPMAMAQSLGLMPLYQLLGDYVAKYHNRYF